MKIKNPKLTLTVVGDNATGYAYALDDNNEVVENDIDSNGTYELVVMRFYNHYSGEYFFIGAEFEQLVEISNAVNCTLENDAILITDPTKDASCTVLDSAN